MSPVEMYASVNQILEQLDFNALFEGFKKYRFALYNSKEIVLDGITMPYQEDFRGNTSIKYEGEHIAIWNLEFDPIDDLEELAYLLTHEMFHCHQRANNETRYPSDLELLNYPDDIGNFISKYNENRYLADACEQRDLKLLEKFAHIREMRYLVYPFMVGQELKVETIEGMAEYVGLKALEQINVEKYNAIIGNYIEKLRAEGNLLFDIRRISYFTGALFFICLDLFGHPVKNAFDRETTAYEQNRITSARDTVEIQPYSFIERNYAKLSRDKENTIDEHIKRSEFVACNAGICGYDPMNMFRVEDVVFCSHFVFLNQNDEAKIIDSAVVLKMAEGSNDRIVGYYL